MRSLIGGITADLRRARMEAPVPLTTDRSGFQQNFIAQGTLEQQMRAYGQVPTLFSVVHRLANAVSDNQWLLLRGNNLSGRTVTSQGIEEREIVDNHAALDVWNRPNPHATQAEFVEAFSQHLDLTGECYWVTATLRQLGGIPAELWLVRPDRMTPVVDPFELVTRWDYISPMGKRFTIDPTNVIQLKYPNPLDPVRGLGPVQSMLVDLDSARFTAEWNRNFFLNSALPGGIIQVDRRLEDDEFDEQTARWNSQHRGVANAHRVAIIEHGEWVNRSFSMRDMQFRELMELSSLRIRETFGMSKTLLGQTEDVNRATAEAAEYVFAKYQVRPRLNRIRDSLNFRFLPLFGTTASNVEFDYIDPVPENIELQHADRKSRVDSAVALVKAGFAPDQVLETVGLPPMDVIARATPALSPAPADVDDLMQAIETYVAARAELVAPPTPALAASNGSR